MRLYKNLIVMLFLLFLNGGAGMATIIVALFLNDLSFKAFEIGIVVASFGVGSLIGGYLGGHISDKVEPAMIVSFSMLFNGIAIILFPLVYGIIPFSIFMFFGGFFNGSFRPSSMILLFDIMKNTSKTKVLAIRRVVINAGFATLAPIFGFLYTFYGKFAFIFIGLATILSFLLSLFIVRLKDSTKHLQVKAIKIKGNLVIFITLNLLLVIASIVFDQYKTTYNLFLKNFAQMSAFDISVLLSLSAGLILSFQIPIGMFFDKLNLALGCAIGFVLLGIGMGMTSFIDSFKIAIISVIFWSFAEMILFPILMHYILNVAHVKQGKAMGIHHVSASTGSLIAPIAGGLLYQYSHILLWNLCFFASILGGSVCLFFWRKGSKRL